MWTTACCTRRPPTGALEKVRKSQAAHGVSSRSAGKERQVGGGAPLALGAPHHANTPTLVGGPAAGHALMKTAADPAGRSVLGTLNNCASGITPWGTYLTAKKTSSTTSAVATRPAPTSAAGACARAALATAGTNTTRALTPPRTPTSPTASAGWSRSTPWTPAPPRQAHGLGRAAHEGAWVAVTKDGRAVVYSGEDARFEYIYKFVSRDKPSPGGAPANRRAAGPRHAVRGALRRRRHRPLAAAGARPGPADGGQRLCRPGRGADQGAPGQRPAGRHQDGPPRVAGHRPAHRLGLLHADQQQQPRPAPGSPAWTRPTRAPTTPWARSSAGRKRATSTAPASSGTTWCWPATRPTNARGQGQHQGRHLRLPRRPVAFDARGVLWIQTDMPRATPCTRASWQEHRQQPDAGLRPATGEIRRFLTGPTNCEITGATFTPDGRTMFINVQHPGESPSERSDPARAAAYSNWPDYAPAAGRARPRW
jgi:secreted PhoX family phosphatase